MDDAFPPMDVLAWVAVVFAAGFIGYFGRYLAKLIIQKTHKGKPEEAHITQPAESRADEEDYKLEKKRFKREKKIRKKVRNPEVRGS
jgi:hypothetical protein